MSKIDKTPDLETSIIEVVAAGNSDDYSMLVIMPENLPSVVGRSPFEIADKVREKVVTDMALREEEKKLDNDQKISEGQKTSVGYSRAYADNWGNIFDAKKSN